METKIETKSGLIGWYHGSIKSILTILNRKDDKKLTPDEKFIKDVLNHVLEVGNQTWEEVKTSKI